MGKTLEIIDRFCESFRGIFTSSGLASQVCGTNLITYESAKEVFQLEESGVNVGFVGFGSCEKICVQRDPICGSDARTYYNYCHLVFAVRRGVQVTLRHPGHCGMAGEYVGPPGNKPSIINNVIESRNSEENEAASNILEQLWTREMAGKHLGTPRNKFSFLNNINKERESEENANSNNLDQLLARAMVGKEVRSLGNKPSTLNNAKKGRHGYQFTTLNNIAEGSNSEENQDELNEFKKIRAMAEEYVGLPRREPSIFKNVAKGINTPGYQIATLNAIKGGSNSEDYQAESDKLDKIWIRAMAEKYEGLFGSEPSILNNVEKGRNTSGYQFATLNNIKEGSNSEDYQAELDELDNIWIREMAEAYERLPEIEPSILNNIKKSRNTPGYQFSTLNNIKERSQNNQVDLDELEKLWIRAMAAEYVGKPANKLSILNNVKENRIAHGNLPVILNNNKDNTKSVDNSADSDDSGQLSIRLKLNTKAERQLDYGSYEKDNVKIMKPGKKFENNTHTIINGEIEWPFLRTKVRGKKNVPIEDEEEDSKEYKSKARSYKKKTQGKRGGKNLGKRGEEKKEKSGRDNENKMQLSMKFKIPRSIIPSLESARPLVDIMKLLGK